MKDSVSVASSLGLVAHRVGAFIESLNPIPFVRVRRSHLAWVRLLKVNKPVVRCRFTVAPCVGAFIERFHRFYDSGGDSRTS